MISLRPGRRLRPAGGSERSDAPRGQSSVAARHGRQPPAGREDARRAGATADGGLVAALRPALESRPGSWVGWDGGTSEVPAHAPRPRRPARAGLARASPRSRATTTASRTGRSGRSSTASPTGVVIDRRWWHDYTAVNERFAERALEAAPARLAALGARLPARLRAGAAAARRARRGRSASSCTSRSRPRALRAAALARPARSRACSAPTSVGFQTEEYRDRTSSAPACA